MRYCLKIGQERKSVIENSHIDNTFHSIQSLSLIHIFLDPEARGQGLGARLLCLGMEQYGVSELTVNEQNPAAAGFYRHMGFAVSVSYTHLH